MQDWVFKLELKATKPSAFDLIAKKTLNGFSNIYIDKNGQFDIHYLTTNYLVNVF